MHTSIYAKQLKIHAAIASGPAHVKIWYIARSLDPKGSGRVCASIETILELADRDLPTIYEWLREAKRHEMIRQWEIKKGVLTLYYSSLFKVCAYLGLENWGVVGEVPAEEIKRLRSIAVELESQSQQEKSEFAARAALKQIEEKHFKIQPAYELIAETDDPWGATSLSQSSLKSQFVYRGISKVFVGADFIPYGASQKEIAAALGCSDRTVRRHQVGLSKKQLVQTKPDYQLIAGALKFGLTSGGGTEAYITETASGLRLYERNGTSSAVREGGHQVAPERFFQYFGETWIYRCNLYITKYELTSMKFARNQYEKLIVRNSQKATAEGATLDKEKLSLAGKQAVSAGNAGGS